MARPARPFALYRRPKKKKKQYVYYAKIRNPQSNLYDRTVSTGQSSRAAAELWTLEYIKNLRRMAAEKETDAQSITISELARGFWEPDSQYAESRRARGYSISNGHLKISESYTRNHILPRWGVYRVNEITAGQVDEWILDLHRKGALASATVNKLLQNLRALLDVAVARGYIRENPASFVKPLRTVHRPRGVLTDAEVRKLLSWPGPFSDYRMYALNLLAFSTGARIGEIRGLTIDHIHPDHIEIVQAWEEGFGLKEPKYDSKRAVPISRKIYQALRQLIETTRPQSILFYSATSIDMPMSKSYIEQQLYKAIINMMLPDSVQQDKNRRTAALQAIRDRGITFHSWRHKLNTVLRAAGIPDSKIRILTGHRGEHMTDWYTKFCAEDYADVLRVQRRAIEVAQ